MSTTPVFIASPASPASPASLLASTAGAGAGTSTGTGTSSDTNSIQWSDVEDLILNYFMCNCLRPSLGPLKPLPEGWGDSNFSNARAGNFALLSRLATDDICALYPSGPKIGKEMWISHVTKTYNRYLSPFLEYSVVDSREFVGQMRGLSANEQRAMFTKVEKQESTNLEYNEWSLTVPWSLDIKLKTGCAVILCCCWLNKNFRSTGKNTFNFRKSKKATDSTAVHISFVQTISDK